MSHDGGAKAVVAALAANAGIAGIKFVAFALTGASSMLAEAIHSSADCINQVLLLIGGRRSQRPADEEHPFGYGRVRVVYGFVVAIILFTLGGVAALFEAKDKWHEIQAGAPNELLEGNWWWVPIVVLLASMVLETGSLRTAMAESRAIKGNRTWVQFVETTKKPELPVVLMEDTAALTGLVFALFGVVMTIVTGNAVFDVAGTAMIGLLLIAVAVVLVRKMGSLLVGEGASPADVAAIREAVSATPGVEGVIHLRTLWTAPDEMMVAAKIGIEAGDAGDISARIDDAERRIRGTVPHAVLIYLEPDIRRPNTVPQSTQ